MSMIINDATYGAEHSFITDAQGEPFDFRREDVTIEGLSAAEQDGIRTRARADALRMVQSSRPIRKHSAQPHHQLTQQQHATTTTTTTTTTITTTAAAVAAAVSNRDAARPVIQESAATARHPALDAPPATETDSDSDSDSASGSESPPWEDGDRRNRRSGGYAPEAASSHLGAGAGAGAGPRIVLGSESRVRAQGLEPWCQGQHEMSELLPRARGSVVTGKSAFMQEFLSYHGS
ncbi:hypothetical protein MBLNU459_g1947t1 [Dothideomycetes sp. NU459]